MHLLKGILRFWNNIFFLLFEITTTTSFAKNSEPKEDKCNVNPKNRYVIKASLKIRVTHYIMVQSSTYFRLR
jgi:hypothetical protein